MPLFARDSTDSTDSKRCPFILPYCETNIGPGPAIMNAAATAKESIQYNEPSLRDPNAALDKYAHRMAPEMIIGAVFVAILVSFALGLWIVLDKGLRARLRRWLVCGRQKEAGGMRITGKSPAAPRSLSRDSTAVEDIESAMSMPSHHPFASRLPSPLRQNTTETKTVQSARMASVPLLPAS